MTGPRAGREPGPEAYGRVRDRPSEARALTAAQAVSVAAVVWIAAVIAPGPVPTIHPAVAVIAVAAAVAVRRPLPVVLAAGLVAAVSAQRAEARFVPVEAGPWSGPVALVDEAEPLGWGRRAVVRLPDGRRVQAVAFGPAGHRLAAAGVGDRLDVTGRLQPLAPSSWTRSRHLLGELVVREVSPRSGPGPGRAVVEWVRGRITAGAEPLAPDQRALYLGLVVGEDRDQAPAQRARFRAAGMSHLLAVSGQNVAFVLAVVAPALSLIGRRSRLVVTGLVLVGFALATRLEPSVLRATTMAGLSAWAAATGREAEGLRPLAAAVALLIVADPFLVHAVGFQLSVAASAAIVVGVPPLSDRLPVPTWLRPALAVTVAAQIGVSPLLVHRFGSVPVAAVPANLVAGPAAGLVMVWGLTVGVVAGLAPAPVDGWLQAPVRVPLWWLDAVAGWALRLPLPVLGGRSLLIGTAVGAVLGLGWVVARSRRHGVGPGAPDRTHHHGELGRPGAGGIRVAGLAVTVLAVAALALAAPAAPLQPGALDGGGLWYPSGPDGERPSVLVVSADADRRLLDALVEARIDRVDLVVAVAGHGPGAQLARAVTDLVATGRLVGPPQHRIVGAHRVTGPLTVTTGHHVLLIEPSSPSRLTVEIDAGSGP